MYSIGKLAEKYHLSRTTLLYYESIGLLTASGRTSAGYRVYSEADAGRLAQILLFREMGISLEEIKELLAPTGEAEHKTGVASALLRQLNEINLEISQLRTRQERIIRMLRKTNLLNRCYASRNQAELKNILARAGIDETNALQWHADFEKASPWEHEQFLTAVGFSGEERKELIELVKQNPSIMPSFDPLSDND